MRAFYREVLAAFAAALLSASCATPPLPPPPPLPPLECGALLPFFVMNSETGTQKTVYGQSFGSQLLFLAGLDIDANGAPNAYHPDDVSGLDSLSKAGRPGNWPGLATKTNGTPFVQGASDLYPGYYISTTALTDPEIGDRAATRRYVDARNVPYFVLPGGSSARHAFEDAGMKLGDFAMVYNLRTRKMAGAIWAENGSYNELGEGSIKLAEMLGYANTSPRTGGTTMPENVFLIFPGTSQGFPGDLEKIKAGADDLLLIWGGEERLEECADQLKRR